MMNWNIRTIGCCLMLVGAPAFGGDKDSSGWNINVPHGPAREVAFDTDEGTWMSVDLSSDGKTVFFDLLGGAAFDAQPRYSPDGKRISFTRGIP